MGEEDFFIEIWQWISINTPLGWIGGSVLGLSLASNLYLFKKLKERDALEKKWIFLLEKLEPLLVKIINKGDKLFTQTEIEDAKIIRNMVNFKSIEKC